MDVDAVEQSSPCWQATQIVHQVSEILGGGLELLTKKLTTKANDVGSRSLATARECYGAM
jgi:hypothetical protein